MKKWIALLLALVMTCSLISCGNSGGVNTESQSENHTSSEGDKSNTEGATDTEEDTSTIEEHGTLETEITSENTNSLEKRYEVNYQYDAIVVTQDYGIFPVDNTTPYQDLITKTVDIHNFASHFEQTGGRGIDDVMEFMGVECLRETEAGALYSVHKVEQGGLLYILYSNR
jgi:hypothetical protein